MSNTQKQITPQLESKKHTQKKNPKNKLDAELAARDQVYASEMFVMLKPIKNYIMWKKFFKKQSFPSFFFWLNRTLHYCFHGVCYTEMFTIVSSFILHIVPLYFLL